MKAEHQRELLKVAADLDYILESYDPEKALTRSPYVHDKTLSYEEMITGAQALADRLRHLVGKAEIYDVQDNLAMSSLKLKLFRNKKEMER